MRDSTFMMSRQAIICVALSFMALGQSSASAADYRKLRDLYSYRQYFELRDSLREYRGNQAAELLFYRGAVSNSFNRPQLSIAYLNDFLKRARGHDTSGLLIEAYEMLADNYRKTYQYRKAAETYETLLTMFGSDINAEKKQDYENEFKLWNALQDVPRQTARSYRDSVVNRDIEGHFPVAVNDRALAFAFDTGANLSVITNSLAHQLGLKLIDAGIEVGAVAGNKVNASLGVARKVEIGSVVLRNVVFLVFDDKDLYISEANFQINGLIGFPVIAALREVTFVRDGKLVIAAKPTEGGERNMCLDGFTPLIAGWFKGERLIFALDTGASRSSLYPPFYKKYEDEIEAKYDTHNERVRGVGGYREIKGYLAKDISITFSRKEARFTQISILTEQTSQNSHFFYGNLGQDLIKQFARMTINFEAMSIVFE
jgi:predicted aspartyl protease